MRISRALLALFFMGAGVAHILSPAPYLAIMPPFLPAPLALVLISGIAEIAGGVGVLFTRTRRAAGIGLITLLVAVFPANLYAALHGMHLLATTVPAWLLWLRLPLQVLLIYWVFASTLRTDERRS